jgi:phosphoribosylpyrophosphate synthetase
VIVCTKVREGDRRFITIKEGDAKDRHVVIVDDLVKTGGTLIECKEALFQHGAKSVSAFVTHAVFPQEKWKRFLPVPDAKNFEHFFITDSCPQMATLLKDHPPFEVLSLDGSILDVIHGYTTCV